MIPARGESTVLWHCASLASSEYASLHEDGDQVRLHGFAALPRDGVPCRIDYRVALNRRWFPMSADARVTTPGTEQRIELATDGPGRWTLNGVSAPSLDGCYDVDLGWTPATNTIPIRRLDLALGDRATIAAAWIRFPELDVVRSDQTYQRLAADRWRYRSGEYDFELLTDVDSGLVLEYGDDLWRAVAITAQ